MRFLRLSGFLAVAFVSCGCFQLTTTVRVNGDGSGTIQVRQLIAAAALAQLRQFSNGTDPLSEDQARQAAAMLGPGVTYVSSAPISEAGGHGREVNYAFADLNQVRLAVQPPAASGGDSTMLGQISWTFSKQENGNALVRIQVPQPPFARGGSAIPPPEQIAMIKSVLAGAHVVMLLDVAGQVVRASTPYVDGSRVTLMDVDVDRLLQDDVLQRLRAAENTDQLKSVLTSVPGVKINTDSELTVEFQAEKD
jgi:hypothetical protein